MHLPVHMQLPYAALTACRPDDMACVQGADDMADGSIDVGMYCTCVYVCRAIGQ